MSESPRNKRYVWTFLVLITCLFFFSSCSPPQVTQGKITITVTADGKSSQVTIPAGSSVQDALTKAELSLGNLDRVNPPAYTVLSDGAEIQIIRVREEFETQQEIIPYEQNQWKNESLPAGETRMVQAGSNGMKEITIRHVFENGVETSSTIMQETVITPPTPEIIMIGVQAPFAPLTIPGKLAYLAGGNAWVMETSTSNRKPLVTTGDLDGRIFVLSPDGSWLLFSRKSQKSADQEINSLWVVSTTSKTPTLIPLNISNVIQFADWYPGRPKTIIYSTAEPRSNAPGWQANNDLYTAKFVTTGGTTKPVNLLEANSGGVYGWWGTSFYWSPDGNHLAYARPDEIGLVDLETNTEVPLLSITPYNTHGDWAWIPEMAWGADSKNIYAVTHEPAEGLVSAEESPNFALTAISLINGTNIQITPQVGMFCFPSVSQIHPKRKEKAYSVAYMEAIFPAQSGSSRYRIVVMDRDGSNRKTLFPAEGMPGLEVQTPLWSPAPGSNGDDYVAVRYQGNLWLIDALSGEAQQVTGDGLITRIDWK